MIAPTYCTDKRIDYEIQIQYYDLYCRLAGELWGMIKDCPTCESRFNILLWEAMVWEFERN